MFNDPFANAAQSVIAPSSDCFPITPNDSTDLPKATKALFVGTGGDVLLRPVSGSEDILFRNLPDGSILDVRVRAVRATGTSAADLVGLA